MKQTNSRRKIIIDIATLAIIIATIIMYPIVGCICLLCYIWYGIIDLKKQRKNESHSLDENDIPPSDKNTTDEMISQFGEPDEVIIANHSKAEGKNGVVLVYREKGIFIINGLAIRKDDIVEVMIKNENNPYLMPDYQIRVVTKLEDNPYLFIETGNSSTWAEDVLKQIQNELVK